ncbi:hypothetical protein CDAR_367081 [Caerostris darwini]|uniref:Uncharacterized protein n=1 Tax=Caerostris darwini TaxID=1538125 RepID=A0AAV4WL27_9ARAC|nr:hypothetical protein CDAR_367081 [Caerostris darwini]
MSSTSVRECPLSLCGIVLYLCAVWEYPLPLGEGLCGNICVGMSSISVRGPLSLCGIVLYLCAGISSTSVRDCNLCGNVLYLCAGISSISVRDCSLSLCGNILYLGEGL